MDSANSFGLVLGDCLVTAWIFISKYIVKRSRISYKKSRIRETKHLSTDADSSTDAIGGWTKAKSEKKTFFCAAIFNNFQTKMFISETTSFHYFSPWILNL